MRTAGYYPTKSWSRTSAKEILDLSGERMVACHRHTNRVLAEGFMRSHRRWQRRYEVGKPLGDEAHDLVAQPFLDIDTDIGVRNARIYCVLTPRLAQREPKGIHID
jgi:hypothetical protein